MTLSEKFNIYFDSFFDEVSKIYPLSISDKTTLSNDLFINYGNREMLPTFENIEPSNIFKLIANKFVPEWEKIINALKEEYIAGIKTVETWSGNDTTEYTKNDTNTDTTQISPYNDDNFADSEKRTNTNIGNDKEVKNKGTSKTSIVSDGKTIDYTKTFIEYLQSHNIYDIINKEVSNALTIMIRS